jgi:hypothetical protein
VIVRSAIRTVVVRAAPVFGAMATRIDALPVPCEAATVAHSLLLTAVQAHAAVALRSIVSACSSLLTS